MYEEIRSKEVKTRKTHFCVWCGAFIPIASYVIYRAYKFDGDFTDDWMHVDCSNASQEVDWRDYPDGFAPGSFQRGSTESID